MALLETFRKRQGEADTATVGDKAKLWGEYREILGRNERPRTKDADRLVELVAELNLDERQVEMHLAVIQEHERLQADTEAGAKAAGRIERAEAVVENAKAEYDPHRQKYVKVAGEQEQIIAEARDAGDRAQQARENLDVLRAQFADLLTGKAAPPESENLRQRRVSDALHATAQRLGFAYP